MDTEPKILYVDDEPINLQLFEIVFSKKYKVYTASDGFEGLDVLDQENGISVIFTDMKMPVMSGIEFVEKAREKFPNKKYYLLTGFEITPEINSALENGLILKYFRKPFNAKEIENAIES